MIIIIVSDQLTQEKTYSDTNSGIFFNIIWKAGGNDVKIAGTFGNWKITNMKKNFSKKNIIFEKEIPIPNVFKEKYQFKFIVDTSLNLLLMTNGNIRMIIRR